MAGQCGQTWTLDEPGRTDLSLSTTVDDLLILLRLIQFQKDIYGELNLRFMLNSNYHSDGYVDVSDGY